MADAKQPKLTLVDAAIEEAGAMPGVQTAAVKAVLNRYAPSIAKRARAQRESEMLAQVGAGTIEEISSLPHLRASFEREEAKHVKGAFGWGALWGAVGGFVMAAVICLALVSAYTDVAFSHAQQATQNGAFIGAAAANQDPAARGHDTPHVSAP